MKTRRYGVFTLLLVVLLAIPLSLSAMVEVDGFIHNDTTWTDADTILVTDLVVVDSTARLTIQPGTVILFGYNSSLWVWGQLYAEGDASNDILFTSVVEAFGGTPSAGSWLGVNFYTNSSGIMEHCVFRYATNGVLAVGASVEFYDCLSENFSNSGFHINGGSDLPRPVVFERCTARQENIDLKGEGTGLIVYQAAEISIAQCRFYDCLTGIDLSANGTAYPRFTITHCDIRDNLLYGIYVHTCT